MPPDTSHATAVSSVNREVELGVVLGMTTTVAAFFPMLKLTMGHRFHRSMHKEQQ